MGDGIVVDGTVARDLAQTKALWAIREGITGALGKSGAVYKYDVSLPPGELYDLVEEMRPRVRALGAEVSGFGHLGDGNLHLNIHTPGAHPARIVSRTPCRSLSGSAHTARASMCVCIVPRSLRDERVGERRYRALCLRVDRRAPRFHLGGARHRCGKATLSAHVQEPAAHRVDAGRQGSARPAQHPQPWQGAAPGRRPGSAERLIRIQVFVNGFIWPLHRVQVVAYGAFFFSSSTEKTATRHGFTYETKKAKSHVPGCKATTLIALSLWICYLLARVCEMVESADSVDPSANSAKSARDS